MSPLPARFVDALVPDEIRRRGLDEERRARLIVGASLAVVAWGPLFLVLYGLTGPPVAAPIVLVVAVAIAATPLVLRLTGSTVVASQWHTLALYGAVVGIAVVTGGAEAPAVLWSIAVPVMALALGGPRAMSVWLPVTLATQTLLWSLPAMGIQLPQPLSPSAHAMLELAALGGLTVLLLSVAGVHAQQYNVSLAETNARLLREVQEHRKTRSRLRRAEQLEALGRVVAGVGHEVNNPLSYVMNNLELLEGELRGARLSAETRSRMQELVADARLGGDRIRDAVSHIAVFRQGEDRLGAVDVPSVVEQSLRLVHNEARHHARIVKELDAVPRVMGNAAGLSRILVNLILNAADALPLGRSEQNEIRITSSEDGSSHVVIAVSDTGEGIAEEHLDRVFEPFFTTKDAGRGTGLGLAICHELVTRFGGTIDVDSRPGRGTTLSVRLPVAQHGSDAPSRAKPAAKPSASGESSGRRESPHRASVLVADDDAGLLRVIRRGLRDHDVTVAESGSRAIELCLQHGYDAVLCDLMMPDTTGIEVYERVREQRPALAERFVFMTGGAIGLEASDFCERMGERVISKPFTLDELRSRIEPTLRLESGASPRASTPGSSRAKEAVADG